MPTETCLEAGLVLEKVNVMESPTSVILLITVGIPLLIVVFLLPVIIAAARGVEEFWLVVLVTFIGGATFVPWPAAMILALALPGRSKRERYSPAGLGVLPFVRTPAETAFLAQMMEAGYDYRTAEGYIWAVRRGEIPPGTVLTPWLWQR